MIQEWISVKDKILGRLLYVERAWIIDSKTGERRKSIYTMVGHSSHLWDERGQEYITPKPYYETKELRKDLTKIQRLKIRIAIAIKV